MPIYFFPCLVYTHRKELLNVIQHTYLAFAVLYRDMALSATSSDQVKWFDIPTILIIARPIYTPLMAVRYYAKMYCCSYQVLITLLLKKSRAKIKFSKVYLKNVDIFCKSNCCYLKALIYFLHYLKCQPYYVEPEKHLYSVQ